MTKKQLEARIQSLTTELESNNSKWNKLFTRINIYQDEIRWFRLFLETQPSQAQIESVLVGMRAYPYHLFTKVSKEEATRRILAVTCKGIYLGDL